MKKGGSAKGELVLAIYELANCFRNGWGVKRDPVAAVKYYETAANLGDTDAMNEAAWCYLEGFGCKKDKVSSEALVAIHRKMAVMGKANVTVLGLFAFGSPAARGGWTCMIRLCAQRPVQPRMLGIRGQG